MRIKPPPPLYRVKALLQMVILFKFSLCKTISTPGYAMRNYCGQPTRSNPHPALNKPTRPPCFWPRRSSLDEELQLIFETIRGGLQQLLLLLGGARDGICLIRYMCVLLQMLLLLVLRLGGVQGLDGHTKGREVLRGLVF